jgi:adenylate cyclase
MLAGLLCATLAFAALSAPPIALAGGIAAVTLLWGAASYLLLVNGFFLAGLFVFGMVSPIVLVASSLLEDPVAALALGGEKLWVTALFTDIADFTAISEEMPAEKTSEMLNAYFTDVMEVIHLNQGTLLKFIGDAVFAMWGAPIKLANHAELAIKSAIAIQREVERFNESGRFRPLITRIGIHTGPMLVGNLGSKRRLDYTAIGDSVNLASRVEGLNKYFGTRILFTEATRRDAANSVPAVRIGAGRVKGRREVVQLYTAFEPDLEPTVREKWNTALDEFSQRRFDTALELLDWVGNAEPRLEPTARFYGERCREFQQNPPGPAWAGEFEFDKK